MKNYRDILLSKWLLGAMLVVAAELTIAPRQAQARCGDYVMIGGHAAHHFHVADADAPAAMSGIALMDEAIRKRPLAVPGATSGATGRADHRPCSGPMCSNDEPRPMDVPTAPVETEVRQWGLMAVQWLETIVAGQFAEFSDDAAAPRMVACSVFRPPR
jgi:hypothetical protein